MTLLLCPSGTTVANADGIVGVAAGWAVSGRLRMNIIPLVPFLAVCRLALQTAG
jgi:hypothetical protein